LSLSLLLIVLPLLLLPLFCPCYYRGLLTLLDYIYRAVHSFQLIKKFIGDYPKNGVQTVGQ
jgi:hypothetical protein